MVGTLTEMSREFGNSHMHTTKKFVEVHCQVFKKLASDSLGCTLVKKDGQMSISKIAPKGYIAQQTNLREGDIILAINKVGCSAFNTSSINGIQYEGLSVAQVGQLLKATTEVTIRAIKPASIRQRTVLKAGDDVRIIEAVVTRNDPENEKLGFHMRTVRGGGLCISKTIQGGLVTEQHTGLRPGYTVLSIGNADATNGLLSAGDAAKICNSEKNLVIRAQRKTLPKDQLCEATVFKTVNVPLGVTLRREVDGPMVIATIRHDSLVYHTEFQPGYVLVSINDFQCEGKTVKEVNNHLKALPAGNIALTAKVA